MFLNGQLNQTYCFKSLGSPATPHVAPSIEEVRERASKFHKPCKPGPKGLA